MTTPTPPAKTGSKSAGLSTKRIQREIEEIQKNKQLKKAGYKLEIIDNDVTDLKGEIFGPEGTPYETGHFSMSIKIPTDYPFKPPAVKFLTRIWHPNVSSKTGCICLDILKTKWTAALNIRTVMISLQALLSTPVPDDPLDSVVGGQYLRNKEMFDKTAQYWTHVFADGEKQNDEFKAKEQELIDIGFDADKVRCYLSQCDWDTANATNFLLDK